MLESATKEGQLDMVAFIKVAGMMGSEHAGERLAAVERCNMMLKRARMTWADVIPIHAARADNNEEVNKAMEAAMWRDATRAATMQLQQATRRGSIWRTAFGITVAGWWWIDGPMRGAALTNISGAAILAILSIFVASTWLDELGL
jgi:putative copper export protein